MRSLAQGTGGRAFFPMKIEDLAGVYGQVADELASQYTIGYTSSNPTRDGKWRRLVVQVLRPSLTARAKNGYYALRGADSPSRNDTLFDAQLGRHIRCSRDVHGILMARIAVVGVLGSPSS
jgi:hypothetical protein